MYLFILMVEERTSVSVIPYEASFFFNVNNNLNYNQQIVYLFLEILWLSYLLLREEHQLGGEPTVIEEFEDQVHTSNIGMNSKTCRFS